MNATASYQVKKSCSSKNKKFANEENLTSIEKIETNLLNKKTLRGGLKKTRTTRIV